MHKWKITQSLKIASLKMFLMWQKVYNIKWQKVEYKLHIQFYCLLMYLSKSKPVSKCFKIITLFLLSGKKLTKFVIIQQQPVSGGPGLAYRNLWGMQSRILFLKDLKMEQKGTHWNKFTPSPNSCTVVIVFIFSCCPSTFAQKRMLFFLKKKIISWSQRGDGTN